MEEQRIPFTEVGDRQKFEELLDAKYGVGNYELTVRHNSILPQPM